MKKKLITVISSLVLFSSVASVLPEEIKPVKSPQAYAACKAYGTQYVSKKAVNEIAANRKKFAAGSEPLSILLGIFGKWSVPIGLGLWADKNRVLRNTKVFADAAAQGKRVKITFCQGPTPNLPTYKYSIVN